MKYFIDTEFHEFKKKPLLGKSINTIDLISIGMVAEDGREYYAISKEFDLWNALKNNWLRDNVLKPVFNELNKIHTKNMQSLRKGLLKNLYFKFSYISLLILLKWYGKSNAQIAKDVKNFTLHKEVYFEEKVYSVDFIKEDSVGILVGNDMGRTLTKGTFKWKKPKFYAYYADYDWVVFCWLFGKMISLPEGFPKYCIDLKQMLDENGLDKEWTHKNCPDPEGEHNALADAKWNLKLFNQIK
ncbi:hypothetical protein LCGC14_2925490 [marine sediment metagenome]|uniref:Uncharacterized protein n=1 Tax=marine sediment metagenome TaxID=412755 RepID=A0A0F8ZV86_9ZZZZ